MTDPESLRHFLETALAFAHAALDDPSDDQVARARRYAEDVMPRIERLRRLEFTLSEARQVALLLKQLRSVLAVVERRHALAQTG
jgi:hypothetical protein